MAGPGSTRWTVIRDAAEGDDAARGEFVRLYEPVVRAYLRARWHHSSGSSEVEDAAQEVFIDFFRESGALSRVESDRPGGFRAYLYGVVRMVARRFEKSRKRSIERAAGSRIDLDAVEGREETLSRVFDREWASLVLEEAARHQANTAREKGEDARRRVRLLAHRFEEGLPIREIARLWDVDPAWLHHQYAQAREEFRRALEEIVRAHQGGAQADTEAECDRLLLLLR
jgi:RNA polymerase sigma-70 factor (ECF subfamily)